MMVLEARYTLETPLIQGQSSSKLPEITPASFKSALRFWWRALAWADAQFFQSSGRIREAEKQILGTELPWEAPNELSLTVKNGLRLPAGAEIDTQVLGPGLGAGASFLAFRLWAIHSLQQGRRRVVLQRPCMVAPAQISVRLIAEDPIPESVVRAFKLLGLLGGLGYKVRRGFGSLTLQKLVVRVPHLGTEAVLFEAPTTVEGYCQALRDVLNLSTRRVPPFPALSMQTRVVYLGTSSSPSELLEHIGNRLHLQRHRLRTAIDRGRLLDYLIPRYHHKSRLGDDLRWNRPTGRYETTATEEPEASGQEHLADKSLAALAFHIHRLDDARYIGIASILPCTEQWWLHRDALFGGVSPPKFVPQQLDELLLRNYCQGYVGPGHPNAGQRWFPEARMLLPSHIQLEQERHPLPGAEPLILGE